MTLPLAARPIRSLREDFAARRLSPNEVLDDALAVIERTNPCLRGFLAVTEERARADASRAEHSYRVGTPGPLEGIPVGVKDLFAVAGAVTTHGSLVHRHDVSRADGGVARRLAAAGAVIVGKTNTSEFGQSATTENRLGRAARTPWDPARTAGGSSGGSAVAVATGACTVAVGSDAGGSVRIPAAYCGLVGLKPTHGTSVTESAAPTMAEFNDVGPLARRIPDLRVLAGVLQGVRHISHPERRLRIGVSPAPEGRPVDPAVAHGVVRAVGMLQDAGHSCEEIDLPLAGWQEIFSALVLDGERRLHAYLHHHLDQLTEYQRVTLEAALRLDDAVVERARSALPAFRQRVAERVGSVDVVCTPATAVGPFPVEQRPRRIDGRPVDRLWGPFPFAAPISVAGLPAVVVPVALVDGLPVAVQLVGAIEHDGRLMQLAEQLLTGAGLDLTPPAKHAMVRTTSRS